MSNNIELVSYVEYPADQYTKAVCTISLDGKYLVAYGKRCGKDGQAWWKPASFQVDTGGGSKAYIDCFTMDSNKANATILEFIRATEKAHALPQASSQSVKVAPISSGVAEDQGLPF